MKTVSALLTCIILIILCCDFLGTIDNTVDNPSKDIDTVKHDIIKKVDSLSALVSICGTSDLRVLANMDSFSTACELQMQKFLPLPQNSVSDRLMTLGAGIIDSQLVLFCTGTGSLASVLSDSPGTLRLFRYDSGVQSLVDTTRYIRKKFSNFSGTVASISAIQDYSGSMSDTDIDEGVEIFTDIFSVATLSNRFETDIILFSDTVLLRMDFSSNADSISKYIARDNDFERKKTRLFDALGAGFNDLSRRTSPIRLIIVSTDGNENASSTYPTKEAIFALSKTHRIPVIILGSMLADLDFMKEVSRETGGAYIYSRTILELKQKAVEIGHLFENAAGFVLDSMLTRSPPDSFALEGGGQRIVFPQVP